MKLIIIRHGDPDYEKDSLTEKGWREAELLSRKLITMEVKNFYMSPLGRAQDTASITLKKLGRDAKILPWLKEFYAPVIDEAGKERIPWDWLPAEWTSIEDYYDKDRWHSAHIMRSGRVAEETMCVNEGLDELLKKHGYERNGNLYQAVEANNDTIILFCHFGVQCIMLGHLLGISPMVLWQGFCATPSSVTTLITEERRKGIAYFRLNSFGDVSHLYAAGEKPAFAARFCETFDNMEERHD